MVRHDELDISGGVYQQQQWDDEMALTRVTWYRELTVVFDLFLHRIDSKSKFYQWFSKSEKEMINSCTKFFVTITYNSLDHGINQRMFLNQMKKNGYETYAIATFAKHLRSHPDYLKWTLHSHKIAGQCLNSIGKKELIMNFPGYRESVIKL